MNTIRTEVKTRLNLQTGKEEQTCIISKSGKVVYMIRAEIRGGKVYFV